MMAISTIGGFARLWRIVIALAMAVLSWLPMSSNAQVSRIVVVRADGAAPASPYFIALDGKDLVRLGAGERSEHIIAPGSYTIAVKCFDGLSPQLKEESLPFVARAGEDSYFLAAPNQVCAGIRSLPEAEGRSAAAAALPVRAAQLLGTAPAAGAMATVSPAGLVVAPAAAPAASLSAIATPVASPPAVAAASQPAAPGTQTAAAASPAVVAPTGDGRIYFFRSSSILGLIIQPEIRLNGVPVGKSQRGTFFYVDRPAGPYTAAANTEAESKLQFDVEAGQTYYIQSSIAPGFVVGRVQLEHRSEEMGKKEIAGLEYTGTLSRTPSPLAAVSVAPRATQSAAAPAVAPSATPSASSALAGGRLRRGDVFEYEITDRASRRTQNATLRVDRADDKEAVFNSGVRIETQAGEIRQVSSLVLGELDRVTPSGGWMPSGVIPRGARELEFVSSGIEYKLTAYASPAQALATRIGSVQAIRIELEGWARTGSASNVSSRYRATVWLAPELRRVVRFEVNVRIGGNMASSYTLVNELVELIRIGNDG